jgi:hypothetical protein
MVKSGNRGRPPSPPPPGWHAYAAPSSPSSGAHHRLPAVCFGRASAGEYAATSSDAPPSPDRLLFVAVLFTPYMGVKLLPAVQPKAGGHATIYDAPRYRRLRGLITWCVDHRGPRRAGYARRVPCSPGSA